VIRSDRHPFHLLFDQMGYDTVDGRRPFGVVFSHPKGGISAFIAAIASGLFFHKPNIGHSNYCGLIVPNRNKMGSNY